MNYARPHSRLFPPQLRSRLFLTDAGLETDLIFNQGFELPAFAAHTLLEYTSGRAALTRYFKSFIHLAAAHGTGLLLDCVTWRAQGAYAGALNTDETELWKINQRAVAFASVLRTGATVSPTPIVLNGLIGPSDDAYTASSALNVREAQDYHAQQVGWLAETDVDCITAMTFNNASEAAGVVLAASAINLPVAVSFTVETDGTLPSGQTLAEAIAEVDARTGSAAMYFMVNCAHPDHFAHILEGGTWTRRIRGMRCNASRCSHAELDQSETLDAGDPVEMGALYSAMIARMPWMNIVGGCCGTDLRHITQIAQSLAPVALRA